MHIGSNDGLGSRILQVWLIGEGLDDTEQLRAPKGTWFIPYSQFPPRKPRTDCYTYSMTPAMGVPKTLKNVHSCEVIRPCELPLCNTTLATCSY